MATLSDEQVERAAKLYQDEVHRGTPRILGWDECSVEDQKDIARCLRAAAPFLQLPWDEPTAEEKQNFLGTVHPESNYAATILDSVEEFVRRRNAALLPKPVHPRRDAILVIMREELKSLRGDKEFCSAADRILAALDEVK